MRRQSLRPWAEWPLLPRGLAEAALGSFAPLRLTVEV